MAFCPLVKLSCTIGTNQLNLLTVKVVGGLYLISITLIITDLIVMVKLIREVDQNGIESRTFGFHPGETNQSQYNSVVDKTLPYETLLKTEIETFNSQLVLVKLFVAHFVRFH